jgi:hypothetical protein
MKERGGGDTCSEEESKEKSFRSDDGDTKFVVSVLRMDAMASKW